MKITRSQLSRIINEEISSAKKRLRIVREAPYDERDRDFNPDDDRILAIHPVEDQDYTKEMKIFRADVYKVIRPFVDGTGDFDGCVEVLNFLATAMSGEGGSEDEEEGLEDDEEDFRSRW